MLVITLRRLFSAQVLLQSQLFQWKRFKRVGKSLLNLGIPSACALWFPRNRIPPRQGNNFRILQLHRAGPAKTFAGQPRRKTQEPRPAREVQRPRPRRSWLQERRRWRRTQECVASPRYGESPGFPRFTLCRGTVSAFHYL